MTMNNTDTHWRGELILATCPVWWILPVSHLNYRQRQTLPLSDPPKVRCSSSDNTTAHCMCKILHEIIKISVFAPCICIFKDNDLTKKGWHACTPTYRLWRPRCSLRFWIYVLMCNKFPWLYLINYPVSSYLIQNTHK